MRENVKPKPTRGTGMLSAAGSGSPKPKLWSRLALGAGKIRSPLPPPPHDPVAARSTSGDVILPQDNPRHNFKPPLMFFTLRGIILFNKWIKDNCCRMDGFLIV